MKIRILFVFLCLFSFSCNQPVIRNSQEPLKTVSQVDLDRYTGLWYEIASAPNRFQKNCTGTTAEYSLMASGDIRVINTCRKKTLDGKIDQIEGKAWVTNSQTNAELKVQFFWPFAGDYWIIDLGKNYEYAVVSEPKGRYLWILSRTAKMKDSVYQQITEKLKNWGYDLRKVQKTLQK